MELTPIRIRGRRKRSRPSDNGQDISQKARPRPWKAARFNHASLQAMKSKKVRRDPNLSYFEQLPTELVQVIFESCNNISLPLSSFVFARKLSHRNIYLRFALDLLSAHVTNDASQDNRADNAAAVSRMLQCKWMTWDIFKASIEELQRKQLQARPPYEDSDDEDDDDDPELEDPRPDFDAPYEQIDVAYLTLNPRIQLPQKLLQGPWTTSKISFLSYLIWHGASIDWTYSSRGEVATTGLDQAISSRNAHAVTLLCCPAVNVVPDTTTLRSAVLDHGCDPTIIFHLINAGLRAHISARTEGVPSPDINFRDSGLWSWAGRVERAGNEKGKWLLDVLRFASDAATRNAVYDEQLYLEFKRACGREEDGVVDTRVPIVGQSSTQETAGA